MKKVLSVLTALMMTGCLLAGCGGSAGTQEVGTAGGEGSSAALTEAGSSEEGSEETASMDVSEMPVVTYICPAILTFNEEDVDEVEAEINKLLAQRYQIQTELIFISAGAWSQQSSLMMTSDEVDVLPLYPTPLSTFVNNGQVEPLDEYLANASDAMKAIWTDEELSAARIDGVLYGIPAVKCFANNVRVVMSEEIVNAENIDISTIKTLDDLEEILYQIHEKYPDIYPIAPQAGDTMTVHWTWDGLGDEKWVGVLEDQGQSTTVKNLFETDDFIDFSTRMHRWYQDGLIMSDVLSNSEYGEQLILGGKAFAVFYDDPVKNPTQGTVATELVSTWTLSNSYSNITYGINVNSANKDAAWKLIEAFYTDKEIVTLLVNGIEGKHYIVNEDGTMSYPDGQMYTDINYGYAQQSWLAPNAELSYPIDNYGADYFEKCREANENSLKSQALGFCFNSANVANEYTACLNIMEKYYKSLLAGVMDPATTLDSVNEELKAAGLDTIIAEKQAQLDAFLAEKNE